MIDTVNLGVIINSHWFKEREGNKIVFNKNYLAYFRNEKETGAGEAI